jgi:Recombination endonuclease VII.
MGKPRRTHCMECGIKLDEINTSLDSRGNSTGKCYECKLLWHRKHHQETKTPEKTKKYQLKSKYNMTLEEYDKLVEFQQNGCAICRQLVTSERKLAVDHNHKTGEIRGLLCFKCNSLIGLANDDEDLLWKAMEYLKRTTWNKKIEVA